MTSILYSYHISHPGILDYNEIIEVFDRKGYSFSGVEINNDSTLVNLRFWKPSDKPEISVPLKHYKSLPEPPPNKLQHRYKRQKVR